MPPQEHRAGEWIGEYYGSFGGDGTWEDAVKYGFFGAGGGRWYGNTLGLLEAGGRIWVNKPKAGYLGVGIVEDAVVPCDEFLVDLPNGTKVPIVEVADSGKGMPRASSWLHTVARLKARFGVE